MTQVTAKLSMGELRQQLQRPESYDFVTIDPRDAGSNFAMANGKVVLNTGGDAYMMKADAYTRLASILGIPSAYVEKTPHSLMLPHFNHWMKSGKVTTLGFSHRDGVIQAYTRGERHPVSNYVVLDALDEVLGTMGQLNVDVTNFSNDTAVTQFDVVTELEHEVVVGDPVRAGVAITNSYSLVQPLSISAYVHRLRCTNGAISTDTVFKMNQRGYSGDDGDELNEWLQESLVNAFSAAANEVQRLRDLRTVKLGGHLAEAMDSVFADLGIPVSARQDITTVVIDEHADTAYDLYNAITSVASHSDGALGDATLMARLMRAAGRLASHPTFCDSCHRLAA